MIGACRFIISNRIITDIIELEDNGVLTDRVLYNACMNSKDMIIKGIDSFKEANNYDINLHRLKVEGRMEVEILDSGIVKRRIDLFFPINELNGTDKKENLNFDVVHSIEDEFESLTDMIELTKSA